QTSIGLDILRRERKRRQNVRERFVLMSKTNQSLGPQRQVVRFREWKDSATPVGEHEGGLGVAGRQCRHAQPFKALRMLILGECECFHVRVWRSGDERGPAGRYTLL